MGSRVVRLEAVQQWLVAEVERGDDPDLSRVALGQGVDVVTDHGAHADAIAGKEKNVKVWPTQSVTKTVAS